MIQLCLRLKMTDCSLKDALASAMSFMPNQAAMAEARMKGTQTKPAFCIQIDLVTPLTTHICGSPHRALNMPVVMTSGTRNCMALTPRLPSPAFRPRAVPFCDFGKKKLMFDMLEAKFPPPKPHNSAKISMVE